jgi:hypothetical protein
VIGEAGLFRRDLRVGIAVDWILAHRRAPRTRRHHFDRRLLGPWEQDFVRDELHVLEAERRELVARPFSQLSIARRPGEVRLVSEIGVRRADAGRGWHRLEAALEVGLLCRARLGEPKGSARRTLPRRHRDADADREGNEVGAHSESFVSARPLAPASAP